jgi:hypothetical protein
MKAVTSREKSKECHKTHCKQILKDAANAERSAEVKEVLKELIDKAACGGRTERIRRDVLFFEFFATQINKEKKWSLNKRMLCELRQKEFDELITKVKIERRHVGRVNVKAGTTIFGLTHVQLC